MSDEVIYQQWRSFLRSAISDFKQTHRASIKDDMAIAKDLMEVMVAEGVVDKGANGKYILPLILDEEGKPTTALSIAKAILGKGAGTC